MAIVAYLESSVCAADVHPTVCRAVSCDGGFVRNGTYLALSVGRAGVGPPARFIIVAAVLYDPDPEITMLVVTD